MIEFFSLNEVLPFSLTLGFVFALALLEGIGVILGFGIFALLDGLLPDFDLEFDANVPDGGLTSFLSWMNIKKVPLLVAIVCFLSTFGLIGVMAQYIQHQTLGFLTPLWMALPAVFILSIFFSKYFILGISKIMPRDESTALSMESFIGKTAVIILGTAKKGFPAECKLEDKYGQCHYFMVEPEDEKSEFKQGESVLLSKIYKNGFLAIKNNFNTLK